MRLSLIFFFVLTLLLHLFLAIVVITYKSGLYHHKAIKSKPRLFICNVYKVKVLLKLLETRLSYQVSSPKK